MRTLIRGVIRKIRPLNRFLTSITISSIDENWEESSFLFYDGIEKNW